QIELNTLAQKENEKVDKFAHQFKKLLKRVDLDNKLPDSYVIRMFLEGLHEKGRTYHYAYWPAIPTDTTNNNQLRAINYHHAAKIESHPIQTKINQNRPRQPRSTNNRNIRNIYTLESANIIPQSDYQLYTIKRRERPK
ncbi:1895_t:CDS:2, partial [Racocetra persica]